MNKVVSLFDKNKPNNVNMFDMVKHHGLTSAVIHPEYKGKTPSLTEWQEAAGLNFETVKIKETWQWNKKEITGDNILIRSDTGEKLGNCRGRYNIVQPSEVVSFFGDLTDHYGWTMNRMGYCDNGKKIYAFAKSGQWEVQAGDRNLNHLLIMTSSDGSTATTIQPFTESLYCFNQLPMAARLFQPVKIRHSSKFNPAEIKFNLGIYEDSVEQLKNAIRNMAKRKVSNQEALSAIYHILKKEEKIEDESTKNLNLVTTLFDKYAGNGIASHEQGRKGTAWGVLNAITEYTTHEQGRNENNRFRSSTMGTGRNIAEKAFLYFDDIVSNEKEIELIQLAA